MHLCGVNSQPKYILYTKYRKSCHYLQLKFYLNTNSTQLPQWIDYPSDQLINSYLACGYKAGDVVTYEIRAGTNVGYGPEAIGYLTVIFVSKL